MRIEAEALFRHHRNEAGTGFESGVVELLIASVLFEVGGIGRRKKGTFMVVEPPGDSGRTGIFEIDDHIFIAVELLFVKKGASPMEQAGVNEICVAANPLPVEAAEQGGRGRPVKTLVMVKDTHSQNGYLRLSRWSEKQLGLLVS
jgi:hypothetical protein